jgi:hypothetical protein
MEHSAGSVKTNTIAWAAHRLSTLHDAEDRKAFSEVVVITDRVILDRPDLASDGYAVRDGPATSGATSEGSAYRCCPRLTGLIGSERIGFRPRDEQTSCRFR